MRSAKQWTAAVLLWIGMIGAAFGAYPDRPIKLIVGFPAGQATDIAARIFADRLGQALGQAVVVENRPGQGGSLGLATVAKAPADGYTMVFTAAAAMVNNPHLYKDVGYDPRRDFQPVALLIEAPLVLVAHPSAPFNTLAELIAYAKANPGKLNYSSVGNGTMSHLAMERLKRDAGISLLHIPYQGSVRSMTDLIAGTVGLSFDTLTVTAPHIEAGKLKAIAVGSRTRVPSLPAVPTVGESGYPGFEASPWLGMLLPKGTASEIVTRVQAELDKIMKDDTVQKSLSRISVLPRFENAKDFAQLIEADYERWGRIVKESGARVD